MLKYGIYVGDCPNKKCDIFLGFIRDWTNDGAYTKALRKFGNKVSDHVLCMVERV